MSLTKQMKLNHLWIDQYGTRYWARTVKELRAQLGGGKVSKMYMDMHYGPLKGKTVHSGYVIGDHWLNRFAPVYVVRS